MVALAVIFAALFGLVVGSFMNVLIYRLPRGESIVYPGSHCPDCYAAIPWYLNIPVLSWLFLRGRCARCGGAISVFYPLVESLTALLFVFCTMKWGVSLEAAAGAIFCALCLALALIDLQHRILPDALTYPGIAAGLLLSPFVGWTSLTQSLAGAVVGAAIPSILIGIYALFKVDAMGWGDVKFLALIGAFTGWRGVLLTLVAGSLLGIIIGGTYLVVTHRGRRTPLPFGTFLGVTALGVLFWGNAIWQWYFHAVAGILP